MSAVLNASSPGISPSAFVSSVPGTAKQFPAVPESARQLEKSVIRRAESVLSPIFFPDFESEFQKYAVSDYLNVFASAPQFCSVADRLESLSFLRNIRNAGTPGIADYFCIKAFSNGVSMDGRAIREWNSLSESEREFCRKELRTRHFSGFGPKGASVMSEIDALASAFEDLVTAILESDAAGELDDELFFSAVDSLEDLVFTVAQKLKILTE